jgi:thioredoxin 2
MSSGSPEPDTIDTQPATSPDDGAAGAEAAAAAPADAGEPQAGEPQAGAAGPAGPDIGPATILTCPACGKKNRIRPNEHGTPHCGSCGQALAWVVNATDETFGREAQASVAVLVDLWAPWCGPCRYVSPMLEELAREYAGRLKVVKVNVDENPGLATLFSARSIPTLVIMRDGRVVDRVVGAIPKSEMTYRLVPYLLRRA